MKSYTTFQIQVNTFFSNFNTERVFDFHEGDGFFIAISDNLRVAYNSKLETWYVSDESFIGCAEHLDLAYDKYQAKLPPPGTWGLDMTRRRNK